MRSSTIFASALFAVFFSLAILACESPSSPRAQSGPAPAQSAADPARSATAIATAAFTPFLASERCAMCHSHSPTAKALTTANGDDASPFGTWQATAMANSFRDPYWRAQMSREVERAPHRKTAIESMCLECHAPITSHTTRLQNQPAPTIESALSAPLSAEGVSCTVCHRATSDGLGTSASFDGRLAIQGDARIYGPFIDPATGPMRMHTGFTPTHGEHMTKSALCGSCHTLSTVPEGASKPFSEQAVYLEWRNSVFSDESGATPDSRTCQQCHMPDVGSMRIARNPGGFDFSVRVRDDVRTHTFVGGNAFMIDMLRANAEELHVTATPAALQRVAQATRAQLAHNTARLEVREVRRVGDRLEFDVHIQNLTGHKLPSGYPSRRMWLDVAVRSGRTTLWESGDNEPSGKLKGVADELAIPHFDRIERADQVAVFEMIAADIAGNTTTDLMHMAARTKDNRILPRGWRVDGPHADETAPIGTQSDDDFVAGSDTVTYSVPIPRDAKDLLIVAILQYQSIPPAWAAALESSRTEESRRFLALFAKADHAPESLATATASVD